MKWVTRERPKIDRLACPWLILRFIDRLAKIRYVPAARVLAVAGNEGAIPFDVPGSSMGARKPSTHRTIEPPNTHQIMGFRLIRAAGPRNIVPPTSRFCRECIGNSH